VRLHGLTGVTIVGQPNLLYVFADQLRYASCGFAGESRARTPVIDGLARRGVSFCNATSCHPLCAPYRASLFTGKYSSSTGMVINELRMNPNHTCFGHVLHAAGYDTAYIGKWHLWANSPDHEREENQFVPPGPYRLGFDGYWAAYNFWHDYYHAFYYEDTPRRIAVRGYEPDVQTDLAIRWLREGRDPGRPFALFLSYGTPHDPWTPDNVPPEYAAAFDRVSFDLPLTYADGSAEYWHPRMDREWWLEHVRPHIPAWQRVYHAMIANLDWNLGRLLEALDRADLSRDTIVVFTSDHGEMFGAHGRIAKNIYYDEACRVPFLLRWPGHVSAGHISDACLNTPDILPTLLSLMGLPLPEGVEGMDLSHCARGEPGREPEAALLQGMGHTYLWQDGFEWRALRGKRFTYAVHRADGREELYDNLNDPHQVRNLAADPTYADVVRHLQSLLRRRMEELGDSFEACTWYRDHWTRDRVILHGPAGSLRV
jgi:arylsulfatase A-like enzyme